MSEIRLSEVEARAFEAALIGDLSDPIALMKEAGVDVATFFEFGDWRYADFSRSNLNGVSFRGADLRGTLMTDEQLEMVAKTGPKYMPKAFGKDRMAKIDVEDLISLVRNYNPKTNEDLLREAYAYGEAMHEGQFRRSGEPYFTHPVAVAGILTEQCLDDATIITALLHDTIEDTKASYGEVAQKFGTEVAELVDGVTKLTNLQLSSSETKQAENFRKLFMAMSKDPRVILVKLADRLHNMRTIKSMTSEKQAQKARETMDIFAPLAGRMGMQWMREELEDLAFRVLNPEGRSSIIRRFITLQRETGDLAHQITNDIRAELEEAGIPADVYGRANKPYGIWRKMRDNEQGLGHQFDTVSYIVQCESLDECYAAFDIFHRKKKLVVDTFGDYFDRPFLNGYQSIHATFLWEKHRRVKIRFRSNEADRRSKFGAFYTMKAGYKRTLVSIPEIDLKILSEDMQAYASQHKGSDSSVYNHYFKNLEDQISCVLPANSSVTLIRGATPLDAAYVFDPKIGERCVGATIDGSRVPLGTPIRDGQAIEFLTLENREVAPSVSDAGTGYGKWSVKNWRS